MLGRVARRLRQARTNVAARRAAAHVRRRAAALPRDAGPDAVTDFLFSAAARAIEAWQIPDEFRALARRVAERRPRSVLEIGTADGGTLFAHARLAHEEALIVSLDLPEGPFGGGYPAWRIPLYESFAGPRQKLVLLRMNSHAPATAELLDTLLDGRRFEYVFIDGDHTYDGVRQDFELCLRLAAPDAMIAFHDIAARPNPEWSSSSDLPPADAAVHGFWTEVKDAYAHEEIIHDAAQAGYGIGVLYLGRPHGEAGA